MHRRLLCLAGFIAFAAAARAEQIIPIDGQSDLRLVNHSQTDAVMVTLRFEGRGHTAALPPAIRLEAGEQVEWQDVVETLFGVTGDMAGEIVVSGADLVDAQWRHSGTTISEWLPSITASTPSRRRSARSGPAPAPERPTLVHVGDVATFSGSHGVSGTATIMAANVIRLTSLRHDGSAPGLDLRVGLSTTSRRSFTVLQVTARQAFNNATIDLTLPANVDLNSFDTFTVWCYEFTSVIAEGRFRRQ